MGEEETKTEAPEATENGTTGLSEKPAEAVAEGKEVKEDDGVKEMEKDKKAHEQVETEKTDEDSEVKEDKVTKEEKEIKEEEDMKEEKENEEDKEKEESKTEAMEEENGSNEKEVDDEKEDKEDEKEKSDEGEDQVQQAKVTNWKGSAKRAKGKSGGGKVREKKPKIVEEKKEPEPRTPTIDRPVRERKSVERLVASVEKDSSRELHIEKGRGTPLKDIPNVAFKLSRRKTDDTFRLLHSIIFRRRGKAFQIKSNISRFSGFVWHGNEEKQRIKVKEKFDKCNKEKLLEFCDVLDIPTSKTTRRKEDIVMSLIDFLVAPHATTTVLLAEKESNKSDKRKRVSKGSSPSGSTPSKRVKSKINIDIAAKMGKKSTPDADDESGGEEDEEEEEEKEEKEGEMEESEGEEKENGVLEKSDDEMPEQSESEDKDETEDESEEEVVKRKRTSKASSVKKESGGKSRTKITVSTKSSPPQERTKKASAKLSKAEEESDASLKVFSRKKKNEKVTMEKTSTATKSTPKEKPGKKATKGKKKAKEEKLKLTDEKLRVAICEILKEVDFNTATFTDIVKLLARRFDSDLTSRKSSIKLMIQEELTKLADEADEEDGEGDLEKDETQAAGQEEA